MSIKKEAKARIKINKLLERAGWRFFDDPDDPSKPANIQLEKKHQIKFDVEKGIDTRLTIDIVRDALRQESEAIVIVSEDQDLSEAVAEIKKIGKRDKRYISIFSAFPYPSTSLPIYKQGIHGTNWIRISEADYNQCIDNRDYR